MSPRKTKNRIFYWKVRDYEFLRSIVAWGGAIFVCFVLLSYLNVNRPVQVESMKAEALTTIDRDVLEQRYPDFDFLYGDPFLLLDRIDLKSSKLLSKQIEHLSSKVDQVPSVAYRSPYKTVSVYSVDLSPDRETTSLPTVFPPILTTEYQPVIDQTAIKRVLSLQFSGRLSARFIGDLAENSRLIPEDVDALLERGLILAVSEEGQVSAVLDPSGRDVAESVVQWAMSLPFQKGSLETGRVHFVSK